MLSFTLLGQVVLSKNGEPLSEFRSQKEVALLIYLAQTGQSQPREFIADLLWEGRTTQQALSNLRTALTRLRKQAGESLLVTRKSLALAPESLKQVDSVRLLETLAGVGQVRSTAEASTLQTALDTYHGDFLADFYLPDAPQFDKWMTATREQLHQVVVAAYNKLAQHARSTNDVEAGIAVARRWLQVDDLDEAAHTLLIRMLIEGDHTREAIAHYDFCVELLHTELGVAPSADMTALIETVRPTPAIGKLLEIPLPAAGVCHNLPAPHDQFFGRVAAQQDIHERLDQPWCRLVTIVGQGGVGKTRLATTVARSRLEQDQKSEDQNRQYRDGLWLVELADIDPDDADLAEAIAVEIATALDLRLTGTEKLAEQLLAYLQHKQLLLLLDNFEHLLKGNVQSSAQTGVQLLLDILQRSEGVQLIVTSREALRIRAEWTIAIAGLDYPTDDGQESSLVEMPPAEMGRAETLFVETPSDAVALFAARQAQQQRAVSGADLAAARQICQMVEGLPLAIELAAALTHDRMAQTVADELRSGFDSGLHSRLHKGFEALTTSLRDVPQRHRSLQIVFEMSWNTLTPALQQRLAQLSVFRGGFTEDAAQQIVDADAQQLAALSEKSLLTHDSAAGRYMLHAVVRAFAAAKRASAGSATATHPEPIGESVESVEATDQSHQKHARYYLALLAQHTEPLQKNAPQESMAQIEPDIANVRLAWQTGLANSSLAEPAEATETTDAANRLSAALTSLSIYYQLRGLAREGETVMRSTLNTATAWRSAGLALATRSGLERARFQIRLGRYQPAVETINTALHTAQKCADRWAEGMGHVLWGEALWRLGEYDVAEDKLGHALDIAQAIDSTLLSGWCHHHLGIINDIQSRYDVAHEHLEQACDAWRMVDNAQALSNSLNSIGLAFYNQGDFPATQQAMEQALALCTQLDNRHLQSILLNNLSMTVTEQGDYFSAHHYLQLGLELATTNGNLTSQGEIYNNLGRNYLLMGKIGLAVESLEQGLQVSESIGNHSHMAMAMIQLAETEKKQDNFTQAESWYGQALRIARQDNIPRRECEALIGIAELWRKIDEEKARQYSAEAVALAEAIQNPDLIERSIALNHYLSVSVDVNEKNLSQRQVFLLICCRKTRETELLITNSASSSNLILQLQRCAESISNPRVRHTR